LINIELHGQFWPQQARICPMSDAVTYTPASPRASDRAGAGAEAKGSAAPLKAFESALLNVKASTHAAPPPTNASAALAAAAAPNQVRGGERSSHGATARNGGKDAAAVKADEGGPRPAASSTTTAIASGVQGGVASENSAKTSQKSKGQPTTKSEGDKKSAKEPSKDRGSAAAPTMATREPSDQPDALAPTAALSEPGVKAALQSTLEGFANRRVPDAIKAQLAKDGTPVSAEIAGLLDNISLIAMDILDKGPLSDLDFANLDDLFWVSNWFDLFNQSTTTNDPLSHSVSSAMAMPIDILYTRALLVPLVDAERAAAPGLVNRRAVRANTEPTPGAESIRNRPAQ
jgi:hypothetical protein